MKKLLLYTLLFFGASLALAQDPVFSQFYAMPLQINPGFAGTALAPRAGLAYRNQWTGFQSAYRTYAAFYEQSFDRLNSGIGFNLEGDNAGDGIYKTNRFSAVYAYRLRVNDKIALKLGLEMGIHQVNLNWDKLLFPDQLDPINLIPEGCVCEVFYVSINIEHIARVVAEICRVFKGEDRDTGILDLIQRHARRHIEIRYAALRFARCG